MKKNSLLFALILFCITNARGQVNANVDQGVQSSTQPEEDNEAKNKLTGSFEMNYQRHYLWRGILFGNDDVAQPELEFSYKNFTLNLCQNFNYRPSKVPKEFYSKNAFFDEQDVTISYSRELGKFSTEFSAMAYFYFYQPGSPNTAELYNYTAYSLNKGFSLFTENSLDFVSYPGAWYSNNGLLIEKENKNGWSIECTAYAGIGNARFNNVYFANNKGGLNLVGGHIAVNKELGNFFISASGEKNFYTSGIIIESTSLKGTDNFKIAAGINF